MANKQLVLENVARDLTTGQFFDLVLIDGGTSYTAYIRDNPQPPVQPANVAQITSVGGIPLNGTGNVTGSGVSGQVTFWDGATSIAGDAALIWDNTNKRLGVNRASPTALLHVDNIKPTDVGTTPGTAGTTSFQVSTTNTGGDSIIATTGVGGAGSAVTVNAGIGGKATAAITSSTGGQGGTTTVNAGVGGAATVAGGTLNTGGAGGNLSLSGGTGGTASGGTTNNGANGGSVTISGGSGGIGTTVSGNGGAAIFQGGAAAAAVGSAGGSANLLGRAGSATGSGGPGGSASVNGGSAGGDDSVNRAGGNVTLTAGAAKGPSLAGGNVALVPGAGAGTGAKGEATLSGSLRFTGPQTAPALLADAVKLWEQDAAAGDGNLYAINEAGKNERLTGLASRVSVQFDSTNETPANITGLTFNVEAGKIYSFEATLFTTSDVAGGVTVAIDGTATATAIIYEILITDAGLTTQGRQTALAGATGVTAVTAALVKISGTITVNAAGTLTVQASRNAANGTTSVLVGSYFKLIPQGS